MSDDVSITQLLRWRVTQAEREAPPAPRASRLIALARPWWETAPEQFEALWERLARIRVVYGHAMVEAGATRGAGYPVPALIVRVGQTEAEGFARVLYLGIRDRRLSLRFQLELPPENTDESFDVTFVSESSALPLFTTNATRSIDREYRLDAELTAEIASDWDQLRVMDRMPFRFIIRLPSKFD